MNKVKLFILRCLYRAPGLVPGLQFAILEECAHKLLDARQMSMNAGCPDPHWQRELEVLIHQVTYILGEDQ